MCIHLKGGEGKINIGVSFISNNELIQLEGNTYNKCKEKQNLNLI